MNKENHFYNTDCIEGAKQHLTDNSVDLIITDPPYGIEGDKLHKHYNRKEEFVIDGYVEVPKEEYPKFSELWIRECERILKPGGSIYIVSGYTNLIDILNALKKTTLKEINHLIWKYNFGVYTSKKYVSSHYHILFYEKPGGRRTFNTFCKFGRDEKDEKNGSLNYQDREDVWIINREYKPGEIKNKNELPKELLKKMILYSSNENDLICDMFLGSFSTAKVAIGLNRCAVGFEKSKKSFDYQIKLVENIEKGSLLKGLRKPEKSFSTNIGKTWTDNEKKQLTNRYHEMIVKGTKKKDAILILSKEYGRGRFSILNVVSKTSNQVTESAKLF